MEQKNTNKDIDTEKGTTGTDRNLLNTKKNLKNPNNLVVLVVVSTIVGFLLANFVNNNQNNQTDYFSDKMTQEEDSKYPSVKNPFSASMSLFVFFCSICWSKRCTYWWSRCCLSSFYL